MIVDIGLPSAMMEPAEAAQRAATLPAFAKRVSWPPARTRALRSLGCQPAVLAAADGASATLCRLRDVAALGLAEHRTTATELARQVSLAARDLVDFSWEELHAGPWKEVSPAWRELYGTATLWQAACKMADAGAGAGAAGEQTWRSELLACIKLIDMGIMMGGPLTQPTLAYAMAECERLIKAPNALPAEHPHKPAGETAKRLQGSQGMPAAKRQRGPSQEPPSKSEEVREIQRELERDGVSGDSAGPAVSGLPLPPRMEHASVCQLRRRSLPPLEAFLKEHMQMRAPTVITNAMREWPAMRPLPPTAAGPLAVPIEQGQDLPGRWADMNYLKSVAGMRTVPVEVGDTYLDENYRQELITIGDFITRHIEGGPSE